VFDNIAAEPKIAFKIHESDYQREILEALLLSQCQYDTISEALEIPEDSTQIYHELFFDTANAFCTKLDLLEYLNSYEDAFGRDLKLKAVNLGPEYVLFTFANIVPKTSAQRSLVEKLFMATAYKAMAINYNGIHSETTKLATKHAELMLKAYEALNKINVEDAGAEHDLRRILAASDKMGVMDVTASPIPIPSECI